jgi:hypothetical protein
MIKLAKADTMLLYDRIPSPFTIEKTAQIAKITEAAGISFLMEGLLTL